MPAPGCAAGALLLLASILVVLGAGFVKGAVGFAMPMILISGIGSFMPAEIAIAILAQMTERLRRPATRPGCESGGGS